MINCKVQLEIIGNTIKEPVLKEFEYKYALGEEVYYVYHSFFGKYKIKKVFIYAFVCTNIPSYQLSNSCNATEDVLFDNIDEAIKECEKKETKGENIKYDCHWLSRNWQIHHG